MIKKQTLLFVLLIFELGLGACATQEIQPTPTATKTLPAFQTLPLPQTPTAEKTTEPVTATATPTPNLYEMNPVPKELLPSAQAENKSNKLIVFSNPKDESGETKREIYVMELDGSNVKNLTSNRADDWSPIWSPDGKKVLFFSNRYHVCIVDYDTGNEHDCKFDLFSINPDGAGSRVLDRDLVFSARVLSWSPDLKQTTFEHDFWDPRPNVDACCGVDYYGDVLSDIFIVNPIDSFAQNITGKLQPGGFYGADWNPDGSRLAFLSISGWNNKLYDWTSNIYIVNRDGSGLQKLPGGPFQRGAISSEAWSKDGKRLVFLTSKGIAVVNADSSGYSEYQIEQNSGNREIFWLDDNQHLVFTDANDNFYKINTDFTGLEKLTFATETEKLIYLFKVSKVSTIYFTDKNVIWFATSSHKYRYDYGVSKKKMLSPNGKWIAYVQPGDSEQHVNSQLRVINTQNHQDYFVTDDVGKINWGPDSTRLFFLRDQKLFAVNLDGTGLRQINNENMEDFEIQP